jgi:hypothetical protein
MRICIDASAIKRARAKNEENVKLMKSFCSLVMLKILYILDIKYLSVSIHIMDYDDDDESTSSSSSLSSSSSSAFFCFRESAFQVSDQIIDVFDAATYAH